MPDVAFANRWRACRAAHVTIDGTMPPRSRKQSFEASAGFVIQVAVRDLRECVNTSDVGTESSAFVVEQRELRSCQSGRRATMPRSRKSLLRFQELRSRSPYPSGSP